MQNVPVHTNGHAHAARPVGKQKKFKFNWKQLLALLAAVVILAGIGLGIWLGSRSSTAAVIDDSKYQAVFLTNGQVYFGKLDTLNDEYMKLTDIYYLQASANEEEDSGNPQQTNEDANADVQLIKLGNEVHGPVDEMILSKDQILFFENLKDDSQVSASIVQYRSQQQNQQ